MRFHNYASGFIPPVRRKKIIILKIPWIPIFVNEIIRNFCGIRKIFFQKPVKSIFRKALSVKCTNILHNMQVVFVRMAFVRQRRIMQKAGTAFRFRKQPRQEARIISDGDPVQAFSVHFCSGR